MLRDERTYVSHMDDVMEELCWSVYIDVGRHFILAIGPSPQMRDVSIVGN